MDFHQKCASYVINLDFRQDRMNEFIDSWVASGFEVDQVQRVAAIHDSNFGGLGCTKSHLRTITNYICTSNLPYCAVFEDDFIFRHDRKKIESAIDECMIQYANFDVFLLAGTYSNAEKSESLIKKVLDSQSTSAYIFRRDYAYKLLDVFARSVDCMEKYREHKSRSYIYQCFAADQVWKPLQHHDNWYCTIPMLGMQRPSFSDIQGGFVNLGSASS